MVRTAIVDLIGSCRYVDVICELVPCSQSQFVAIAAAAYVDVICELVRCTWMSRT